MPSQDVSCLTDGVSLVFGSADTNIAEQIFTSFSGYFQSIIDNKVARYSEIYEDNLGLGDVLTGVIPIYIDVNYTDAETGGTLTVSEVAGVYGLDLLVSALNDYGAISNADIMAHLAQLVTCPALLPSEDALKVLRRGEKCYPVETNNYGSNEQLALERDKYIYELIASFSFIILFAGLMWWFVGSNYIAKKHDQGRRCFAGACTVLIYCTVGISLLVYVLVNNWSQTVVVENWKSAEMTVLEGVVDSSVCCETVGCRCVEAPYGAGTCAYNEKYLIEDVCSAGYQCCEQHCYQCRCRQERNGGSQSGSTTVCDTCCDCISSVYNRQCRTVCSTCYTGIVVWSYTPAESPVAMEVTKDYSKDCGYGADQSCALGFIEDYPVGSKHTIYYNPNNWLQTRPEEDSDYEPAYYGVVHALAAAMLIPFGILVALLVMKGNHDEVKENAVAPAPVSASASGSGSVPVAVAVASPAAGVQMAEVNKAGAAAYTPHTPHTPYTPQPRYGTPGQAQYVSAQPQQQQQYSSAPAQHQGGYGQPQYAQYGQQQQPPQYGAPPPHGGGQPPQTQPQYEQPPPRYGEL
jgi:hypothetical protein